MCEEYINLQTGEKLDLNILDELKDNSALKVNQNIWIYWNFEKNKESILEVTKGCTTKVWWYCNKCNDTYPQAISKKTINRGCSICKGYYITKVNSFGDKFPDKAIDWDYDLNGNITPYEVSYGSGKVFWFKCRKCPMSYDCSIDKKTTQNAECPYCRGLRISPYNNLKVTNPEISQYWDYDKNGELLPEHFVRASDRVMVYWKCKNCGLEEHKTIKNKKECLICSDTLSFGERNILNILNLNNIKFTREKIFEWLPNKRYDFYINDLDSIIEVHGSQHYVESGKFRQSLKEVIDNDELKYKSSIGKVKHYIVLKSIDRKLDSLLFEIENSGLLELLNLNLDLIKVDSNFSNLKIKSWDLWNDGCVVKDIMKELKLSDKTTRRYLNDGNKLGKCEYPKNYDKDKSLLRALSLYNEGYKTLEISKIMGMDRRTINGYLLKGSKLNMINYLEKK